MQFRRGATTAAGTPYALRPFFVPDVRTSGFYENPGWPADRIKRTQRYVAKDQKELWQFGYHTISHTNTSVARAPTRHRA